MVLLLTLCFVRLGHLRIQPVAEGLLELRGEEVIAEDADACGGGGHEGGKLGGELLRRGVRQVQAGGDGEAVLCLLIRLRGAGCGPCRGFIVEGVVDHGEREVEVEAAPVLAHELRSDLRGGEDGAGGAEVVGADARNEGVGEVRHALQTELAPLGIGIRLRGNVTPVAGAEELLAVLAVAVIVLRELAAHIEPVFFPQTTGEDDIRQAHVVQLNADDAGDGSEGIHLGKEVLACALRIGAKELVVLHKGAVLRGVAGFTMAVDGVPIRVAEGGFIPRAVGSPEPRDDLHAVLRGKRGEGSNLFRCAADDEHIHPRSGVVAELIAPESGVAGVIVAVHPEVNEGQGACGGAVGEGGVAVQSQVFSRAGYRGGVAEEVRQEHIRLHAGRQGGGGVEGAVLLAVGKLGAVQLKELHGGGMRCGYGQGLPSAGRFVAEAHVAPVLRHVDVDGAGGRPYVVAFRQGGAGGIRLFAVAAGGGSIRLHLPVDL